ncbi:MAG: hypothetical protein WA919_01625 [Coleofasciculaceae cyanobacterium]
MSVLQNNQTPGSNPDEQGVSVNIRLPQKVIAITLGFSLFYGLGFVTGNNQSQAQSQKQNQSQTQVSNCSLESSTTSSLAPGKNY